VLILAPTGRDAAVAAACLQAAGIRTQVCHDVAEVCAALDTAAAALVADEALPAMALDVLRPALQRQPVWSDVSVILLTSSAEATATLEQRVQALDAVGNVTVLERPLTPVTLLSTVQVALRSRRRQHELRQLYALQHQHIAQLHARDQALQDLNATLEQQVTARTAALVHEMAERQRLEREAQRAQHFAMLGRLAAGVSHEIRNPLAAVFLHVDLLSEELQQPTLDSPATVAEALTEIKTNLARVEDLVQDYLALVRVGSIEPTVHDLGAAMEVWATEFHPLAASCGVALQREGLATLGPVAFHAATLRRAVLNLVQNALEAMPQGGTLTLRGRSTPTHVQLHIQDTGSGIARAQHAKVFEPLYTTKPGGTGLGLYIVHEIVAAHRGQVTVESGEGQGTTFTITLPRQVREAGQAGEHA
jgi:signal transduction histidine kinase